jgi:2-methylisocitrate lyase-like PEP mutase family enzyme
VHARQQSGRDIVIIARTDALASQGYDEALSRLKAAVEAGADVAFLEGVESREQAAQFCVDMGETPCLFNNVPGGVSPDFSVEEARELGYRIVIFPLLAVEMVYPVVRRAVRQLMDKGTVEAFDGVEGGEGNDGQAKGKRYGPRELFEVCGLKEMMAFDVEAGGTAYANGA